MHDYGYLSSITPTQAVFLCCLFVFGPGFGFIAAYRHIGSRIGGFWAFLFAGFAAYAGWFISGIIALLAHPDYGYHSGPSEWFAMTYTIPGFITGYLGLRVLHRFADRHPHEATKPVEPTGISSSPSDLITSHTPGDSPGGSLRR